MQIDTCNALVGNLLWTPIARILAGGHRLDSRVLLHLFQHRRQLLFVVGLLPDLGGDDDLRFSVHGDLRVVGLHEAAFVRAVGHDPTVWIGEVALRLGIRFRLPRIGNLWWTATLFLPVCSSCSRRATILASAAAFS